MKGNPKPGKGRFSDQYPMPIYRDTKRPCMECGGNGREPNGRFCPLISRHEPCHVCLGTGSTFGLPFNQSNKTASMFMET